MPEARTHVAVVGYGYWGSKHVRVLSSLPGVAVTVVDSDSAQLARAADDYPAASLYGSLDEAIGQVDAVVVATPPAQHGRAALTALEAGRAVLVEKPLATSVAEAELLVETAAEQDAVLMTGHTFEYNPAVRELKRIIRSGALGRILHIDTARLNLGKYQSDVNVIWDLAPHDISIVAYLLDEIPASVDVWAHCNVGVRHADVAHLRLDLPGSGTRAVVHVSWLNPNKVRRVTVVGERKMAVYDDMSDNERIRIYDIGVDHAEADPAVTHAMPVTYRTGSITSPYIPFAEPLRVQDEHFVQCVRTGAVPETTGRRGLDVVRVLSASDASIALGGTAPVPGEEPGPALRPGLRLSPERVA